MENKDMKIGKFKPYKNYTGTIEYSVDDHVYFGQVVINKNLVTYHADNVEDLLNKFHEAVDDYLSICEAASKVPEK